MVHPRNHAPFTGSVPGAATLAAIKALLDAVLLETETALGVKLDNIKTVVDAILVDTGISLEGKLDTLDLLINAIKAVTDNIPDGGLLTALLASIASILADTDTTIPGLLATIQADLDNPDQYKADVAALALEATLGTHDTDIKALLAIIAGYLDTEITAILTAVDTEVASILGLVDTAETDASYSYLDAGGEQTVYEDTATTRRKISFAMDINTMTQGGVAKLYLKVDGLTYHIWIKDDIDSIASGGTEDVYTIEVITNQNFKVTYTEDADEGAARSIPYSVVTKVME